MRKKKLLITGLAFGLMLGQIVGFSGCGDQPVIADEAIELIEPVGGFAASEAVQRRTLLGTAVCYDVIVDPYIEEYSYDEAGTYVPGSLRVGDEVRKGEIIYRVDLSAKEKEDALQERLDALTESYEEYKKPIEEELAEQRWQLQELRERLEEVEDREPEDQSGKEYAAWQKEYEAVLGEHNKKELDVNMNEEALRQRTELYQLDYQYYATQQREAREHNAGGIIRSGMDGKITAMKIAADGETIQANTPVVEVADMDQKLLYCDKASTGEGKVVFAFINGKKYDVSEEIVNEKRVFRLQDPQNEVEIGYYGCIVVYTGLREQVLTVPSEAVNKRGLEKYVYVQKDNEVVERAIKIGMTDGVYTEVAVGLEEGEQVLYDGRALQAVNTAVLNKGTSSKLYIKNGAELYFPLRYNIQSGIKHGTIVFQAWATYQRTFPNGDEVRRGITNALDLPVKAGELIAEISVKFSAAELQQMAQLETDLKRARERLEDLIAADNEADEKVIASRQEAIADMEERLAEMKADYNTTEVRADRDGRILSVPGYRLAAGDVLSTGYNFAEIAEESVAFIPLPESRNYKEFGLGYNTTLTVRYQNWENEMINREAPVVTFNQYGRQEKQALLLDEEFLKDINVLQRQKINVFGYEGVMNNVVVIPSKAVARVKDNLFYVNVLLEDGTIRPTGVIVGGKCTIERDGDSYWVIEGVTEGMTVCWE